MWLNELVDVSKHAERKLNFPKRGREDTELNLSHRQGLPVQILLWQPSSGLVATENRNVASHFALAHSDRRPAGACV